tara:strand:- start:9 stop:404 length:396 start_codon:yes stop_codon:yes gene_type:complete
MSLDGLRTDKPNPYDVTIKESGAINAALNVGGDALPLINLILDRVSEKYLEHNQRLLTVQTLLQHRIEHLERQVAYLTSVAHTHAAVHAVSQHSLPQRRSVLDGVEPDEVPNSGWDGSQSQEEDAHKDIKF